MKKGSAAWAKPLNPPHPPGCWAFFKRRYSSNHLLPVPGDGLPPHTPPPGPARAADPPHPRPQGVSFFGSVFRTVFKRSPSRPMDPPVPEML